MDTCLLTGRELGSNTKLEHTIPESLGGAIKSRRVSCNQINQAASAHEKKLQANYLPLLADLSPLLRSGARPRKVFAVGEFDDGGCIRIDKDGVAEPTGPYQPLPDGSILTCDPEKARAIHEALGGGPLEFRPALLGEKPETFWHDDPCEISVAVEIAALKALLLTLDEMLAREPLLRFTRQPALGDVRDYLGRALLGSASNREHAQFALGYQTQKLPAIRKALRALTSAKPSPFAHSIVASANKATRGLMAVWNVFDAQPIGFRLSTDWPEGSFTCIVTCDVLANSDTGSIYWEDRPLDVTGAFGMSAIHGTPHSLSVAGVDLHHSLTLKRQEAIHLRECSCRAWVLARLVERAEALRHDEPDLAVSRLLEDRLMWFLVGQGDGSDRSEVQTRIASSFPEWHNVPTHSLVEDPACADGAYEAYAEAFAALANDYGMPRGTYYKDLTIETDPS